MAAYPILCLGLKDGVVKPESVQSQTINPELPPTMLKNKSLGQLATWMAAGMENTRRLWRQASGHPHSYGDLPPMVGWTVVGHDWHAFVAFGATTNGADMLYILGPWRVAAADARDVYGAFTLLKLLRRASEYAATNYWPWLKQNGLEPLCTESVA
ncbi:hypothetical protein BBP40_003792 [Aspergillus hancockii]|nr:hypothetical protein BBP40_003792 [Aspergillus hancockii]